jgi:tripartite-type tricarboxylate transporter receptor subunit TctC
MKRRDVLTAGLATVSARMLWPRQAFGQAHYPEHPLRAIVPFPPGGVVDAIARPWAEKTRNLLGTVVIENQSGGGGIVGTLAVARAGADGYTLLFGNTSTQIIAPWLMDKRPYDAAREFKAVSIVALAYNAIVVHPSVPATNLAELVAYAKANAGKLSYGSSGANTLTNLTGEMFKQQIGAPEIVHIPYKGGAPGLTDLLSGHIPIMIPSISGHYLDLHRAGKIRILATCGRKRMSTAPDIPSANETLPGLVAELANGIFVPAGTPDAIVGKIAHATRIALADTSYLQLIQSAGMEAVTDSTPASAQRFMDEEQRRLIPIMQAAGMKQDGQAS